MAESFMRTIASIRAELQKQPDDRNTELLGLLARGMRWQPAFDANDLAALMELWGAAKRTSGPGGWDVERAVLEIFCDRAVVEHVPWLIRVFRQSAGQHGNDRRRLALQALTGVAARTGDETALQVLEEGLAHAKKDTRGWTIGFLVSGYAALGRPLPQSAVERLQALMQHDSSPDVRVEAATALADVGLADQSAVEAAVASAQEQPHSKRSKKRLRTSHE